METPFFLELMLARNFVSRRARNLLRPFHRFTARELVVAVREEMTEIVPSNRRSKSFACYQRSRCLLNVPTDRT